VLGVTCNANSRAYESMTAHGLVECSLNPKRASPARLLLNLPCLATVLTKDREAKGKLKMRSPARSKFPNGNDVNGAALALAALYFTQPDLLEEDDFEYAKLVDQIYEEHCPLFRVPRESLTPAEDEAKDAMLTAILSTADELEEKLRSPDDPLLRALASQPRTTAE
jgi:hypothetical protein